MVDRGTRMKRKRLRAEAGHRLVSSLSNTGSNLMQAELLF